MGEELLLRLLLSDKLSDEREPYGMAVPLSTGDRKALQERAEAEMRSRSNYVATLILEELG